MHPEINIIAPTAFAIVALVSLWIGLNLVNAKPNSGMLLMPVQSSSHSTLS